jgi:hypothetical protein
MTKRLVVLTTRRFPSTTLILGLKGSKMEFTLRLRCICGETAEEIDALDLICAR